MKHSINSGKRIAVQDLLERKYTSDRVSTSSRPLNPVVARPSPFEYAYQLWRRRYFILAEGRAKAFYSAKNMVLGNFWLVVNPLLNVAVYGVIFGLLLKTSRGIENFIPFLIVGVTYFSFLQRSIIGSIGLMRQQRNLIRAFAFPRAAIPLAFVVRRFLDSLPPVIVTSILILLITKGEILSLTWILFLPLFLLLYIFITGVVFLSSWITHIVPDLKPIIEVGVRFWFYGSGVFFSVDRFVTDPDILKIFQLNPGYMFLEAFRDVLVYREIPQTSYWLILSAWSFFMVLVGFFCFWSREVEYSRGV
ncbi:ABC transporter permease [Corynebacterium pygosceleis]|uniref:Transport permease protein n=1 Tax=Corynebacterium pygosceleis TaxID=2800406 RepID=A0ABT3WUF8_9CORY|nr:ABC transporter permease [Corynebacterium pygosceleis]MCK7676246.1 ABC transporter permease [Corynebacterium pygosceleis]MCL0121594.1 ABC transporter permease [Corynebacterium pygosceleis]MCX7445791.1 ABC transporter permease [Corynebacterium pygosceleis]